MSTVSETSYPTQDGRTAVVTGASSGLGLQLTRDLARLGARVVLACRDRERTEAAAATVRCDVPGADLVLEDLELADLASVRRFADRMGSSVDRIDLLVNNAGIFGVPTHQRTSQGFEQQFGVNHLGHFALTGLLLPLMLKAPEARVVTVTSFVYRFARLDLDDLHFDCGYRRWRAYARSKLANMLFAHELERRLRHAGTRVHSAAAHPGTTVTRLTINGPGQGGGGPATRLFDSVNAAITPLVYDKVERGVRPLLHAAVADEPVGGAFFGPRYITRGQPVRVPTAGQALNEHLAQRLWERSTELTGVVYTL